MVSIVRDSSQIHPDKKMCEKMRRFTRAWEFRMKLICVEEHTVDLTMAKAAQAALLEEAPYFVHLSSDAASGPRDKHRPTLVPMADVFDLAPDLGERRIRDMDAHGVDMQVVSCNTPLQLVPKEQALAFARAENDRLAKAVAANPTRLSAFAILPWQDPDAALEELNRAVLELGLKGVLVVGRPDKGNIFLDDGRYRSILQRMHELKVPLYVHPLHPAPDVQKVYYGGFSPQLTAQFSCSGWGWHLEAGIQVLRMIFAKIFEELPNLHVISGHWGEMVPFYLARLDATIPPLVTGLSRTVSESFKANVWVTPSGLFDLPHFEFVYKVMGADRIIWSIDYPYLTMDGTREFLDKLAIPEDDMRKITHSNAEKLFGL